MRSVPVVNGKVSSQFRVVEVNHADIARIPPDNELPSFVRRVPDIHTAPQHVRIIRDLVHHDPIRFHGALEIRQKIQAQSGLVYVPVAFFLPKHRRLLLLKWRGVEGRMRPLMILPGTVFAGANTDVGSPPEPSVRCRETTVLAPAS